MKIEFVEKNYKIGKKLEGIIEEKLEKLDRYFESSSARVVCKLENKTHKLELTIKGDGVLYRAEVVGENMYEDIDLALPKIERQIVRNTKKKKDVERKHDRQFAGLPDFAFIKEDPVMLSEIYRTKNFELDKISCDEAREAMERLDHSFYIFINEVNDRVCVIYKRLDGKYGVIQTNR